MHTALLLLIVTHALNVQSLPPNRKRNVNAPQIVEQAPCTNFGKWQCDATGTKLLQCAYSTSNTLSWYWSGAICSTTSDQQSNTDDIASNVVTSSAAAPMITVSIPESTTQVIGAVSSKVGVGAPAPVPQSETDSATPVQQQVASVQEPVSAGASTLSSSLISGEGSGTYYYDVNNKVCPGFTSYPENEGITSCEPSSPPYKTLASRNDNNIVALALDELSANKPGLCGKKVVVKYNGVEVVPTNGKPFVVWDGCLACTGGVRLDFSLTELTHINENACALGVVPGVSWEVMNEQVIPYVA